MARLFISRQLSENSQFHTLLEKGIELHHESLIDIRSIPFETVPESDWLFFYSKNGIRSFFAKEAWRPDRRYAVMGRASEEIFAQCTGHRPDFRGSGTPNETAEKFKAFLSEKAHVLFVQARNSRESVAHQLGPRIEWSSLEVYENTIKSGFDLPECDYLVFTSPLNARAWFDRYSYNGQKLFAIGSVTASFIQKHYGKKALYPSTPGEDALYDLVVSSLF